MVAVRIESGADIGAVWHYGDPLREQRWLEDGTGVVDLSARDVIRITGPERGAYLNLLGTQKLDDMSPGQAMSTFLLDPQGHIMHFLALVETGDEIWGWTEPGRGAGLVDHLTRMKFRMDVQADMRIDMAVVWVGADIPVDSLMDPGLGDRALMDRSSGDSDPNGHGEGVEGIPSAQETVDPCDGVGPQACPARQGTPNCLGGKEVFIPRSQVDHVMSLGHPVGMWAHTARRIASGVIRVGMDTDTNTLPNEVGVPSEDLVLNKGCYPGQETVARVYNVGAPPRRLVRLHLDGSQESFLDPNTPLTLDGAEVGFLGSMAYHHELGPIGLGLVKRQTDDNATLMAADVPASIEPLVARDVGLHVKADLDRRVARRLM